MLQIYSFRGENFDAVYDLANTFIQRLSAFGIEVKADQIRDDTKNYIEYDTSKTTISIFPNVKDAAQSEEIGMLRREVIQEAQRKEEEVEYRMQVARDLEEAGKLLFRHRDEWCVSAKDGDLWAAIDLKTNEMLIPAMPADQVLRSVQKFLKERFPEVHDDFDPFLDAD